MASGRIEQENKTRKKIDERLAQLPDIFTEFYNYMEADSKSYGTCLHYISYVADFMDFVTQGYADDEFYKNVTVSEIRTYITSLRRRTDGDSEVKNGDSIQATRWSALNTFYNFLVMDDYVEINLMSKTKRPKNRTEKPIVYLEADEIDTILDKIRAESKPQYVNRDLAIVTLGIATGIRVGALVQINVEDINFKDNTIHVIEKGGKERYLKFGNNTRSILSLWLVDRSTYFPDVTTSALFVSQWKQRMTTESIRKLMKKYADGINGKHITPHKMRSTSATNIVKSGIDIQTAAYILGHNSISTTQKYAAVLEKNKQMAVDVLDELF